MIFPFVNGKTKKKILCWDQTEDEHAKTNENKLNHF
jgi:hypothetical protein